MTSAPSVLTEYEPLDIIGNGSFGVIRKVRRKSDGVLLARKELNFERMTERDRKQIVAEVNILKDLKHEHIVRYIDRYIDRENGILYILMEYCGGGDLSNLIKTARRQGTVIPEDKIWTYFVQILLALFHCHFPSCTPPNAWDDPRTLSSTPQPDLNNPNANKRQQQILHRDLKPENVFLGSDDDIKLGDFGLSKQLGYAAFANTYVGTPYYMSPELINEKAYDTKSDIWSLGCLIYELAALNPPFHEAQTHSELSGFIRGGRIPPLPKGYSSALTNVIRSMLNLNPAMRPSAYQLLQTERIHFAHQVSANQKLYTAITSHEEVMKAKERELALRQESVMAQEAAFSARESAVLARETALSTQELYLAGRLHEEAEERKRLSDLAVTMANQRAAFEAEMNVARAAWMDFEAKREAFEKTKDAWERERGVAPRPLQGKQPLDDVKNTAFQSVQFPRYQTCDDTPTKLPVAVKPVPLPPLPSQASVYTPLGRHKLASKSMTNLGSAMRGVILTDTGETVDTPQKGHLHAIPGLPSRSPSADDEPQASTSEAESTPETYRRPRTGRRSTVSSGIRPAHPQSSNSLPTNIPIWNPNAPPPVYDLDDEENLPSPFLKRAVSAVAEVVRRPSKNNGSRKSGGMLAFAAANSAIANAASASTTNLHSTTGHSKSSSSGGTLRTSGDGSGKGSSSNRISLVRAVRVSEDAKKAVLKRHV